MKKCAKCKIKYPDDLLSPGMGLGIRGAVCGICALALSNKALGIVRTEFDGEQAEYMRQEAIEWRKKL